MKGDFPPNSNDTSAKLLALLLIIFWADFGPPVNETRAMSG